MTLDLDYQKIGRRIARRRKQLGLTQSAVEEIADIGYKYLSSIETGKSIPSTEDAAVFAFRKWRITFTN